MRVLALVCFAFAAAVAVGVYTATGVWLVVVGAVCIAAYGVTMLLRKKWAKVLGLLLLGFGLGTLYVTYYDAYHIQPLQQMANTSQSLTVELQQSPQPTEYGWQAVGRVEVDGTIGRVLMYGRETTDAVLGDVLEGSFQISDASIRHGQEDLYYLSKDITLICYQQGTFTVHPCDKLPLRLLPTALQEHLAGTVQRIFPNQAAGLVQALLTGDRSGLQYCVKNDLSRSGISHTVAVSGMHVAMLLSMVYLLSGKRRRLMTWIGCPVVLIFMAMTGFSPSVVRAGLMQIIMLLAPALNRENDWTTTFAFSLAVILLANPWAIASVSLQLSYAAVAGIVLFSGRAHRAMTQSKKLKAWRKAHRLLAKGYDYVAATISTTFGALVFTTPLVALYFGSVSLMSFVTNLLTLFAVSGCFALGFVVTIVGCILPGVGRVLAWPAAWLAEYILWVSHAIASVPYAAVGMHNPYLLAWLVFSYLIFMLCIRPGKPKLPAICCTVLALLCSIFLSVLAANRGDFRVTALDVGQGQCIVMQYGDFSAMFDCGGSNANASGELAAQFLEESGKRTLDVLVLSHYDKDHVGGVPQLLYRVRVGLLLLPDVADEGGMRQEIEWLAKARGTQIAYVRQDTELTFSGGSLTVFAPLLHTDSNNASLCALFSASDTDLLLTGDLNRTGEQCLLAQKTLPDVEILVAGHHGAADSTSEALLQRTKPELVLISVGENSYGHPAPDLLQRIDEAGAVAVRTDEQGSITVWR